MTIGEESRHRLYLRLDMLALIPLAVAASHV
jgi:hypothetical protein